MHYAITGSEINIITFDYLPMPPEKKIIKYLDNLDIGRNASVNPPPDDRWYIEGFYQPVI